MSFLSWNFYYNIFTFHVRICALPGIQYWKQKVFEKKWLLSWDHDIKTTKLPNLSIILWNLIRRKPKFTQQDHIFLSKYQKIHFYTRKMNQSKQKNILAWTRSILYIEKRKHKFNKLIINSYKLYIYFTF